MNVFHDMWHSINQYVEACGGVPATHPRTPQQRRAIVRINRVMICVLAPDVAVEEEVTSILDVLRKLPTLNVGPQVYDYDVDLYVDGNGEPAALVTVVLKEADPQALHAWADIQPIRDAIVRAFQDNKILRSPYVEFRLTSRAENDTEDWVLRGKL